MTDPASGHDIAGDVSIDDQVSALGETIMTNQQLCLQGWQLTAPVLRMKVPVFLQVSMLTRKTMMVLSPAGDILGGRRQRQRQRVDFPWSQTHDWISGDPPRKCKVWFSSATNA